MLIIEVDQMIAKLLDKIAIPKLEALRETKKETKEIKLPNVENLPPEERTKFKELFHEYQDVFAQSKMKFGTMKVPEIKFVFDRNDPASQHPRATAITFEFGRHNDTYTKVPQHPKIPNPFLVKLKK